MANLAVDMQTRVLVEGIVNLCTTGTELNFYLFDMFFYLFP